MSDEELIKTMTLEEKASLMSGKDFWETRDLPRHGIPSLFLADGPHGLRKQAVSADHLGLNESLPATCFPTAATVANSWNTDLGEQIGRALGTEAAAQGVNVLLGPGINMKRSPLCGRNFEYFSEDPHLAGKLAAAYIRGIQSQGVAACVKHFAANNQETGRMTVDTVVDERTLREIYLTAFEIAVLEGVPQTLMSSYNRVNGTYTNEHPHLMGDILRGEWGFRGVVVTDWGGSNDRVEGLRAGNELEMPTTAGETNREIVDAVRSGRLDEAVLDRAVARLLKLIADTARTGGAPAYRPEDHHALARRAAEESVVLLKNEGGLLPLGPGRSVAVIGEFARKARYQGAGSSIVNPSRLEETLDLLPGSGLTCLGFEPGFDRYGRRRPALVRRAAALAARADVALVYLGLDEVTETEGMDRSSLAMPANQRELLEAVSLVNENVVVVLSCGSVVEMPWLDRVKALVHGTLAGQAGAAALLRVLTGEVNPSGKLAETYPLTLADTPAARTFPGAEATAEYREGPYIGYRYYATAGVPVRFPFGFGLSYTTFAYSDLQVGAEGVGLKVTNTGRRTGAEVVQLYISRPDGPVFRPAVELKGFAKVTLNPGETAGVFLPFDGRTFRHFDVGTGRWETEGGDYQVSVGASSADLRLSARWWVAGTGAPAPAAVPPVYRTGRVQEATREDFEALLGHPAPAALWDRTRPLGLNDTIGQCRYARGAWARLAYGLLVAVRWVLWHTGNRGAANLTMMSVYHLPFRGLARMTGGLMTIPMVEGLLTIVNGHCFRGWAQFRAAGKAEKLRRRAAASGVTL